MSPCRSGSSPISVRIWWTAASTLPLPRCLPAPSISAWARLGSSPISVSISSTMARTWSGRFAWVVIVGDGTRGSGGMVPGPLSIRAVRAEPAGRQRVVGAPLGAAQPGPRVRTERRPVVATLLEDHEPPAESGGSPAALVVDRGREREVTDRIVAVRVEPERHDHDIARRGRDRLEPAVQRDDIGLVVGAGRERQVQGRAAPLPLAPLVDTTQEERVLALRIGMERDVQDIAPAPEDLLRPVAVVVVDVEDRDPLAGCPDDRLGGDRGVVEEAVAAGHRSARVMTGRPAQPVRGALPTEHEVDRRE